MSHESTKGRPPFRARFWDAKDRFVRRYPTKDTATVVGVVAAILAALSILVTLFAAWITHIVLCLKMSTWLGIAILFIGAIIFPVGIIHGIASWFGAL